MSWTPSRKGYEREDKEKRLEGEKRWRMRASSSSCLASGSHGQAGHTRGPRLPAPCPSAPWDLARQTGISSSTDGQTKGEERQKVGLSTERRDLMTFLKIIYASFGQMMQTVESIGGSFLKMCLRRVYSSNEQRGCRWHSWVFPLEYSIFSQHRVETPIRGRVTMAGERESGQPSDSQPRRLLQVEV